MSRALTLVTLLVALSIGGFAADVTGKWSGNVTTPDGNSIPLTMVLKVDGDKLTGTVTGPQGDIPITEGKADADNNLEFVLNVHGDAGEMVFKCTAKPKGADELSVRLNAGADMTFDFVAKRST